MDTLNIKEFEDDMLNGYNFLANILYRNYGSGCTPEELRLRMGRWVIDHIIDRTIDKLNKKSKKVVPTGNPHQTM
jgi:hypothetical protein